MRTTLAAAAALTLLAACSQEPAPEPTAPAGPESPPVVTPPAEPPASGAPVLSAQGFPPLRIGMTVAEIDAALGPDSDPNAVGGPEPESCDVFYPSRAPEGLLVMVLGGRLDSVWLSRNSAVTTDRGFKIGDTAAAVKQAYGASAVVEPHKYESAPAEYITVWATPNHTGPTARGLKYEIGGDGRVRSIAGGGESTQYVEGCA